jgi:hypothetical protein
MTPTQAAGSATMTLSPASSTTAYGSNLVVTIYENSGTDSVNAVEADLTYDQTKLQITSANIDTSVGAFNAFVVQKSAGGGVINISAATSTPVTGSQIIATLTFTTIGLGSSSVSFQSGTCAIIRVSDTNNVFGTATGGTYAVTDQGLPTAPTALTFVTSTISSISFSWTASTDNIGVTGYKIYRNGTQVGTSATTSYTDTTLSPNTSYTYRVSAYDAAANDSSLSSSASFSTTMQPGDITGDGHVTITDLSVLASHYGQTSGMTRNMGDLNGDSKVNIFDLSLLAANWGA